MPGSRRLVLLIAAFLTAFGATAASAALQRWTFHDVTFRTATNTLTGEVLDGGDLRGFFVLDTDTGMLVRWNIFTSPGWTTCDAPSEGNVCYTEGTHWKTSNSHVFPGAAFFALLMGDQNTFPYLALFLQQTSPGVMTFDLHNSIEILSDSPDTFRQIAGGSATLRHQH
ncbi:MAG: hypothetical protein ACM3X5_01545 [Bacillota bacterium]